MASRKKRNGRETERKKVIYHIYPYFHGMQQGAEWRFLDFLNLTVDVSETAQILRGKESTGFAVAAVRGAAL